MLAGSLGRLLPPAAATLDGTRATGCASFRHRAGVRAHCCNATRVPTPAPCLGLAEPEQAAEKRGFSPTLVFGRTLVVLSWPAFSPLGSWPALGVLWLPLSRGGPVVPLSEDLRRRDFFPPLPG